MKMDVLSNGTPKLHVEALPRLQRLNSYSLRDCRHLQLDFFPRFFYTLNDPAERPAEPGRSSLLFGGPRNQSQFSVASPATRAKCRVLFVMNVSRKDRA